MRLPALLLTVPLALSLAACGGGDDDEGVTTTPPETVTTTVAAPTSAAPSATTAAPATDAKALIGTIGTTDDPEAYEIGLTHADGTPAQDLPAGRYTITVEDASFMHNWHLTGEGVDVETGVAAKETATFDVTLVAGETYAFVCDPHTSSMSGEVTVV